jgi:DnaJ-class molecular chaperone
LAANPDPGRRGGAGRTAPPPDAPAPPGENHYQLLGVPYTATGADITRAYRAAMKRIHPDRQQADRRAAAEEQAKRLNLAYATLSKPLRRQAYDRTIRADVVQDQIMGRYVGGFAVPQANRANGADPLARHMRREPSAAERRERARADRGATVSLVVAFAGITLAFVLALLLWATLRALLGAAF